MSTLQLIQRLMLPVIITGACALPALAQQTGDDVVRVNTDLVQTDFTVFDKQGNFVDGLKREQFLFKIDGKPREIYFFDRIAAGSRSEEAQIAAARGTTRPGATAPLPLDRGRTVFFFIDDLHLSPGSISYTREMLKRFIQSDMKQNDRVQIDSATGQLGFLQQLTDNKSVLLAAANRLRYQQVLDSQGDEYPPMTEYQSMQIERRDLDLFNFMVDRILERSPKFPRIQAEQIIRGRARQIIAVGAQVVARSFSALNNFINLIEPLPGRKIVFFVSDGFLVDQNRTENWDRLQRITHSAARSGVVIYSIDARGMSAGMAQMTSPHQFMPDPRGILARSSSSEAHATQDGMSSLANDTGGRAFFNTNAMQSSVMTALREASTYYLLSWRPETDEQRNPKFRQIEVSVVGRPDLVVRFHRGFGEPPEETAKNKSKDKETSAAAKTPNDEIRSALSAQYPSTRVPVAISLNFLDTVQLGGTLRTAIKVGTDSLVLNPQPDGTVAAVDVAVVVLNDQGKSVSNFTQRFSINPAPKNTNKPPDYLFYDHVAAVKPGLYQVRVAAVDVKSGARGSAYEWIEVPDITTKQLTMSSLIIGERKPETQAQLAASGDRQTEALKEVPVNVDHRFTSSSYLRLLTFVYNAAANAPDPKRTDNPTAANNARGLPELDVQIQVFRDNEPVITTPLHKIQTDGISDVQRVPYAAEISLNGLARGAYVLQVTVIDKLAKGSATRKLNFQIE